jgi:hypothetical protein
MRKMGTVACAISLSSFAVLSGCSSSVAPSSSGTISSGAAGIDTATTTLEKYTPQTDDVNKTAFNTELNQLLRRTRHGLESFFAYPDAMATTDSSLLSVWTSSGLMSDLYNSSDTETIQGYLGQMFDPSFVSNNGSAIGAAGRYANAMFQACLGIALTSSTCGADTDGLPVVGTCAVTLDLGAIPTSGTYQGCPVPPGGVGSTSTVDMSVTVAAISGNSNYTKSLAVTDGPGGDGITYMKLDSAAGIFNAESIQPQDNQDKNAACGGSRWILAINGNVTDLEYEAVNTPSGVNTGCTSENYSDGSY